MVDVGFGEDESAPPDRSREPDLGAANTHCLGDNLPQHGAVGQVGAQHAARGGTLCARHHRRHHESECGIGEDANRGVGAVQHVCAGQQCDWVQRELLIRPLSVSSYNVAEQMCVCVYSRSIATTTSRSIAGGTKS